MSKRVEKNDLKLSSPVPLSIHPAAVYLSSISPGSVATMRSSLNVIASLLTEGECDAMTLNWARLRYQHTAAIRAIFKERYCATTANKMLCALKRVLAEAVRLDLMEATDYAKAVDFPKIKGKKKLRGRALSGDEISALIEVCRQDESPLGVRDAAIIAILRGTGLRRAELAALELRDFIADGGVLEVREGKGDKDRTVYLPHNVISYVNDWIAVRGDAPGALLCPIRKGGRIEGRHLHPDAVLKIVKKRATQAGVESFSPHDFRRTFCSDLLDAGVDIVTVQKLAGHASPETTAKYDRRGEETKRKAVQMLSI
ncbi:integrase family protein (plasmid) [Gloeothece citriformis PCC 7424]|uniref:Integrase family protein n=1 Tax=Gloeothece citriformis (strain PCC 7424) TaxID=65393 RepID=B7KMX3_GLOC7|nr:site-specific integrase [Gloeothece citriformis]ACK74145.1 integrase family protein [Gloeothece citriformis PCC 7424]